MARPVRPELYYANLEARRWALHEAAEARRHGYPPASAFAKQIARGTLSAGATPDDPLLEAVGRFMWNYLEALDRRVIGSHYSDEERLPEKARRLGISVSRFQRTVNRVLLTLSGYLIDKR